MEKIHKSIRRFNHEQFGELFVLTDENGKQWFRGTQVAAALGYAIPHKAVREHCKGGGSEMDLPLKNQFGVVVNQRVKMIDEADIYRLVMKSRLPQAEAFQDWVCEEVLPSIRKHGAYMTDVTIEKLLASPELVIGLATQLKEEREARKEAEGRASYSDKILACPDLVDITQIAQDYGMTAIRMNQVLFNLGVQFKDNGQWILYSKYKNLGYTQSNTRYFEGHCRMHTKWTQRGRLFLYEFLKGEGILPVMERYSDEYLTPELIA